MLKKILLSGVIVIGSIQMSHAEVCLSEEKIKEYQEFIDGVKADEDTKIDKTITVSKNAMEAYLEHAKKNPSSAFVCKKLKASLEGNRQEIEELMKKRK